MDRKNSEYVTKYIANIILFLLFVVSYSFANEEGDKMNGKIGVDYLMYAELEVRNCSAEGYINGIPFHICRFDSSESPKVSFPVNQYLIDGQNMIELVINPGPTPSKAKEGKNVEKADGIAAEFRLVTYPVGVFVGDESGKTICRASWHNEKGGEATFPMSFTSVVDLGPVFGPCLWQKADVLRLDKSTTNQVIDFIKVIYDAYEAGKPEIINKLASIRLNEGYRAYPERDRSTMGRRFAVNLKKRAAMKEWTMLPFNPDLFDLRLCAGGRMVECIRKDWQPIVAATLEDKNVVYSYAMFLSRINGQWVIVR
ncbi:hypothetical protein [Desulfobacter curvatus]|uniref:hypothetical protein n=1 Tax=Desulfobacter curvatus TaxID=2290 RepID=UPI00035FB1A4|nr:hypothetical protein [Desulfobacter curvatus]